MWLVPGNTAECVACLLYPVCVWVCVCVSLSLLQIKLHLQLESECTQMHVLKSGAARSRGAATHSLKRVALERLRMYFKMYFKMWRAVAVHALRLLTVMSFDVWSGSGSGGSGGGGEYRASYRPVVAAFWVCLVHCSWSFIHSSGWGWVGYFHLFFIKESINHPQRWFYAHALMNTAWAVLYVRLIMPLVYRFPWNTLFFVRSSSVSRYWRTDAIPAPSSVSLLVPPSLWTGRVSTRDKGLRWSARWGKKEKGGMCDLLDWSQWAPSLMKDRHSLSLDWLPSSVVFDSVCVLCVCVCVSVWVCVRMCDLTNRTHCSPWLGRSDKTKNTKSRKLVRIIHAVGIFD